MPQKTCPRSHNNQERKHHQFRCGRLQVFLLSAYLGPTPQSISSFTAKPLSRWLLLSQFSYRDLHSKYPEIRTFENLACRGREVRNHASLGLNLLGPWCPVSFLLTLQTRVQEVRPHPFHLPLYTAQLPQMDLIPRLLYIPALSPESQTLGFVLACISQRGTRWAQTCSSWFKGEKQAEEGRTSTGGCEGRPLPKWQSGLFLTHITLKEGKNCV